MSLLLDALKQAEKAKQERAARGKGGAEEGLDLEQAPGAAEPEPAGDRSGHDAGELTMSPLEDTGSWGEEADTRQPGEGEETGTVPSGGEGAATGERSQSLSLDLEHFAAELADSTGRFQGERTRGDTGPHPADDAQLATMPSLKSVQESLREFYDGTGRMSATDGPEPAAGGEPPHDQEGETTQVSRRDAQNVFAAKHGQHAVPRRRTAWLLGGVAGAVLLVVGGLGLWYLSLSGEPIARPLPPRGAPPPVATTVPAGGEAGSVPTAAPPSAPSAAPGEEEALRIAMTPDPVSALDAPATEDPTPAGDSGPPPEATRGGDTQARAPEQGTSAPAEATGSGSTVDSGAAPPPLPVAQRTSGDPAEASTAPAAEAPRRAAPSEAGGSQGLPIRITREARPDPVQRRVRRAYEAFRAGDHAEAEALYGQALAREPRNRDALLGLAAVALYAGDPEAAQDRYLAVLRQNPRDRAALAALTGLQTGRDPVRTESRLKLLLEQDPDDAYLHFALGNVYVVQSRWPEAQQAFFKAYATERDNADYAYNLAVALDQMGQRETALSYYRTALSLAEGGGAGFDPETVVRRVRRLSDALGAAPS